MVTIFEQGNHVFILNLRSVGITFNLKKLFFMENWAASCIWLTMFFLNKDKNLVLEHSNPFD